VQGFDFFLSIGEIAGVFVGFGALISLLRDRQEEGRVALHGVIANGLVALVAALIPVALNEYGLTGRSLWAWSSGAFLLLCWAALWGVLRNPEIREATTADAKAYPVPTIVLWGLELPLQLPLVFILLGVVPSHSRAFYGAAADRPTDGRSGHPPASPLRASQHSVYPGVEVGRFGWARSAWAGS
jgi:hypothetical protein